MARKLRVQYPGAIYHVMNRGDRRENIFVDDEDRLLFLETLGEACQKTDWEVHAWCLMRNHFHLITETPRANLVAGMQWVLGVYTNWFNHRHKEFGHLFSGRYQALHEEGSGNGGGGMCEKRVERLLVLRDSAVDEADRMWERVKRLEEEKKELQRALRNEGIHIRIEE